jgi:hypothetical protein
MICKPERFTASRVLGYKKRVEIVGRVVLKKDLDGPARGGNPWIFSQAIARAEPAGLSPVRADAPVRDELCCEAIRLALLQRWTSRL